MLREDGLRDGQAKPRSARAAADHRHEDAVGDVRRNPGPVVDEVHAGHQAVARRADGELPHHASAQLDHWLLDVLQRGRCVGQHIQRRLHQLLEVPLHLRQAGVVGALEDDARRVFGLHQLDHPFDHVVDVHRREVEPAVRRQHTVDQIAQAVGLGNDDGGVLPLGFRQLARQQLRGAAYAAQGVSDLVREAAPELAHGVLHRRLPLVAVDADEAVQALELDQQLPLRERRDGVAGAHRPVRQAQRHVALGERLPAFQNRLEGARRGVGIAQQRIERRPDGARRAAPEQRLAGLVQIGDRERPPIARIDHRHGRRELIQNVPIRGHDLRLSKKRTTARPAFAMHESGAQSKDCPIMVHPSLGDVQMWD